jgi:hypothetical protein
MGIVAVAISYVVVSYLLMPLYFLMIRKLIHISIRSHIRQYIPALASSLIMVVVVFVLRYFIGQNYSALIRLIIFATAGAGTYFLALRLIRPGMYAKILELIRMALPKFPARQN